MVLLLPICFLLAASIAIYIMGRLRPRFGFSWLIASIASISAWLTIFFLRLRLPTTFNIFSWENSELNLMGHFSLLLDYESWLYALGLITIMLAVILTDAARTRHNSTPLSWSASLVITAIGLLALQSGTSLMMMATWVLVDLFELFYLLRLNESGRFNQKIILSYGIRMASILMLVYATSLGWQASGDFDLTQIPLASSFFFFLAAGLRLGILPFNLPFLQEPSLRRGAGNILRLAPAAACLSLLARLPAEILPAHLGGWKFALQGILSFAALFAAIRWVLVADEIEGRPYWVAAWAALAATAALTGSAGASRAWGITLLLPGSLLFLYSPRVQRMNFLQFFGLIGLVGLPFTPLASGWEGLIANGVTVWTFGFLLSHAILILGYLKWTLRPGGAAGVLESWARIVYPLGLIIIIQAMITIGFIGWPGSLTAGTWWLALLSNFLVVTVILLIKHYGISAPYIKLPSSSIPGKIIEKYLPILESVLRLDWVLPLTNLITQFFSKLLNGISIILEGEGGILWTLLLLILLITLLTGGGAN